MREQWLKMYKIARSYYLEYGNLDVKREYKALYIWLKIQRFAYLNRFITMKFGTTNYMELSNEQVELLNDIEMIWKFEDSNSLIYWLEMYNSAKMYFDKNGNLDILYDYVDDEGNLLGKWIYEQNLLYVNNELSNQQVKLLEAIGIKYVKNDLTSQWLAFYELARNYYIEHGNLMIKTYYKTNEGANLGIWIHHQRQAYVNTKMGQNIKPRLTDEQIILLENIGMIWNAQTADYRWKKMFEYVQKYYIEHGNFDGIENDRLFEGTNVLNWINEQRSLYNHNKLDYEKKELLKSIGMEYERIIKEIRWNEYYNEAKKYFMKFNNLDVPENYMTLSNLNLGLWVSVQKKKYKDYLLKRRANITEEQVRKLEDIGIVKKCDDSWDDYYKEAQIYRKIFGDLDVSSKYISSSSVKLGLWIKRQRNEYRNFQLGKRSCITERQIKLLDCIDMIWDLKEYKFVSRGISKEKIKKIEERFIEFLDDCVKREIESYDDIKNINTSFMDTFGSKDNNYRKKYGG